MEGKRKSALRRALCALLVLCMVAGILPAASAVAQVPDGKLLIAQTDHTAMEGVVTSEIILNTAAGNSQVRAYMTTIQPDAKVAMKASYNGYYTKGSTAESRKETLEKGLPWDLRTTTGQAADYEAATGGNVVIATNADYYNMQTCQPLGYLIMEGNVFQTSNGNSQEPYFALLKDGTYVIRDFGTPHDDVLEAISGPFYLVKDGANVRSAAETDPMPRNSIGLKADGTIVLILADGRQDTSVGMGVYELAEFMRLQGVVDAIYLDGGGSATIAAKKEGSNTLELMNSPSDGPERVVSSTLLFVSTETGTGVFDHAALEPNNELYVAGAKVQFTASGVDTADYPVAIPEGTTWALADASYGEIDSTGLFQSNGKTGTVVVNLVKGEEVLGTTSIDLQDPDELFFRSSTINLAFKASSDLGLVARCNNRDMSTEGYTFNWKIESTTEGKEAADIGSMSGNIFTAAKDRTTLNANVTVTYKESETLTATIAVEIGKMPKVIFDFEPDEAGNLMQTAEYDWGNPNYGNQWGDENTSLTFLGWDDAAGGLTTKTETGPFTFDGSYLASSTDDTYRPAGTMLGSAGYSFFTWHAAQMKNHAATVDVVSADEGEVRFGDYALEMKYDYTDLAPGYKNVNAYIRYASTDENVKTDLFSGYSIEGTPTGLGVWVYAPEGTPNYWLWTTISYWDENSGRYRDATIHFTTQEGRSIQYNGIYWDGWMYCEADLRPYAQYVTPEHPLKILTGRALILLTFIPGGSANENGNKIPMGDFAAGSLYFDNFRVVYGDSVDDMEYPVISSIKADGEEISKDGSTEIETNKVKIETEFYDPESDNATGINTAKTAIYVDGVKQTLTTSEAGKASVDVVLANGTHSIMLTISDGFGNVTKETRYITVDCVRSPYGEVSVDSESTATLGKDFEILVNLQDSETISEFEAEFKLTDAFGVPVVTFENGYSGTSAYENGVLKISGSAAESKSGTAARITFHVDPSVANGASLIYSVSAGSFKDGEEALSFALASTTVKAVATYNLTTDVMVAGGTGKIYVTTADGKAAGRVEIYAVQEGAEDVLIGKTNSAGVLVTNRFCQTVGEAYVIYAKSADGYSFRLSGVTVGVGSDEVLPMNIRLNAVEDPSTTQSITWFSTPEYTAQEAVVQYVTEKEYQSGTYEFKTATGTSNLCAFNGGAGDNNASLVNVAKLTGLTPGTTYYYRVGDGVNGHWSELRNFTTIEVDSDVSFLILADTQLSGNNAADADDIETLHAIAAAVNQADVDFAIQTGDFIDAANSVGRWNQILSLFSEDYPSTAFVQVLGNHEYYGDISGALASRIFDLPAKDYYSVEYGGVYIAVINCNAELEAAAKWLKEDAAKTDCRWKVLTLHQPPYYTNTKGSSDAYNRLLPAAIDEAGIDFVFSGHDHSYARTEPIANGAVDENNGTVYFICGDLGEKSRSTEYAPVNNPDFHFATVTQDYDAVYLIASLEDKTMTIKAYDLDGTVIDCYSKTKLTACDKNGHTGEYDRAKNEITCAVCGEKIENYTGFATDKAVKNSVMYFLNGTYKTGWFMLGDDLYHFDSKTGIAHTLSDVKDVPTSCAEKGHLTATCECGETYTVDHGNPTGHKYVKNNETDEYYICENCGSISAYNMTFVDVNDSHWFAEAVYQNNELGYMKGKSQLYFDPYGATTRAELTTLFHRIAGTPEYDNVHTSAFVDCKTNSWETAAINWAAKNNIVKGVDKTHFAPTAKITREQMVTLIYRYAEFAGMDVSARADLSKFTDADQISDYAKTAMQWAVAVGLVGGVTPTTVSPKNNATRAEIATITLRFLKLQDAQ